MSALAETYTDSGKLITPENATRPYALGRLKRFLPRAGRAYADTRNSDLGPHQRSNVSTLSPWIRHRLILEEEVIDAVLGHHSLSAADKFVQEVFWRTYFKGWLEHRPQVWQRYCAEVHGLMDALASNSELRQRYEAAIEARSGIDCMDAWTRELIETGYLHNHARMWFASIWIFTLKLPWQLGAQFFLSHLFDGDPASNTLSWRWVAGLHTKGKTYLARASNIEKFTEGRFNPVGQLSGTARPIMEADPGLPIAVHPAERLEAGEPFLLLVTTEDCSPEQLSLPGAPEAVLGVTTAGSDLPMPASAQVRQFAVHSVEDALGRCDAQFGIPSELRETDAWADLLKDRAQELGVKTIVTAYMPVGHVADRLKQATSSLEKDGIRVVQVRRDYDIVAWPHATKGFFALRKKIPHVLDMLKSTT